MITFVDWGKLCWPYAICCGKPDSLGHHVARLMVAVKMNYSEITIGFWGKTVMINKLKLGVGSITLFLIQTMSWDIMHRFEGIVWETGEGKLHTVAYSCIHVCHLQGTLTCPTPPQPFKNGQNAEKNHFVPRPCSGRCPTTGVSRPSGP